jgi:hypothetical protein
MLQKLNFTMAFHAPTTFTWFLRNADGSYSVQEEQEGFSRLPTRPPTHTEFIARCFYEQDLLVAGAKDGKEWHLWDLVMDLTGEDGNQFSPTWFECNWCGERSEDGKTCGPCQEEADALAASQAYSGHWDVHGEHDDA